MLIFWYFSFYDMASIVNYGNKNKAEGVIN